VNICFTCDGNYLRALEISIYSLLENNSEKINLFIIKCSDFPEETVRKICSAYNVDVYFYLFTPRMKASGRFTSSVFARLYLDEILSEDVDKILYLDCDLVVNGKLFSLYQESLDQYYLFAVIDEGDEHTQKISNDNELGEYFNAGFLLFNIKKMRDDGVFESARNNFNENNKYLDQDMLNIAVNNNWKKIDCKYNYMKSNRNKNAVIIHYAHCKPWEFFTFNKNRNYYDDFSNVLKTGTAEMKMKFNFKRIMRNLLMLVKGYLS
jgi:lipopolysaccharide biosynthesis glycosyltransferase